VSLLKRKTLDPAKAELRRWYREDAGIKKPEAQQTSDERELRQETEKEKRVRTYVFARERNIDRVTRFLPAHSRHELRFRSLGGKVTRENCVAVNGDGVNGTHGLLQRNEISYAFENPALGAEGTIYFTARTHAAAEMMRIGIGETIVSPPMSETEIEGLT
jgi:hypothetical protein